MVYIRIQITNGRNIARSFSPLIRLCASKKRGSYISSINVNETEEWKRTWRQIRVNIVRNIKHFLFFSTRLLTELLAKASPSTRIFSVRASIPALDSRSADSIPSLGVSEHPLHSSSSPLPPGIDGRTRGDKRLRSGVDPRIHLRFFHRSPRYLPFFTTPLPSLDLLERRNFISYRPRRDPPILIKRISRHQFRVPWSPRDINYGRQYTRRASYVCRFEYR